MNKPRRWIRLLFAALSSRPFQVHWFYQSAANQQLHTWLKDLQPDVIHCQLLRMAEYVRDDHQVPRVLDFMDALSAGMSRRAALRPIWSRWIFHWEAQRLARYESVIFDYFDAKTIISAADQKLIAHPSRKEISVVPNGVDSDYFKAQEPQRTVGEQRVILFTGNMSYPPNIDAALVLVKDILPTSEILSLACANVEVTGWVPDLRVAYSRADVFVAPLRIGTGQQNKILEAMSMGIPCITTEHVLNGLPFQSGTRPPLSIAATPEETAKAIDDLLIDNNQVLERGKKSREWIEKYNSWDAQTKALEQSFVNSTLYKPEEGAWKIKK
jgi:glycosyltransferase involved in cell wall biosynthesis